MRVYRLQYDYSPVRDGNLIALKTVKQDESIARSRFVDCPVCKNHTLKLKRTVQIGRCKSCSETYKIIVVYVKTGRKVKPPSLTAETRLETERKNKPEPLPESSLPSWQLPSDSSLFGSTSEPYSGLSEAVFGETHKDEPSETGSSSSQ
jgi:ribosomal protein L37AE/L43A